MAARWREERQFGRGVGTVLTLMGAWLIWRSASPTAGGTLAGLGVLLLTLGFVYPRVLVYPNRGWMKLANGLSFVSTRVILALVFFLVVTPLGVVKRLTGWDPLGRRRPPQESYWVPYPPRLRDPKHLEKMF